MKRILLLVGALFFLASCTSELDQMINGSRSDKARQTTVFQASVEGCSLPETKVYADENMKVLWNEGDQITIFNKITYNHGFEFDGEDGDTAGGFIQFTEVSSFSTWADLPYVYAVYPYNAKTKINNSGVMTVTLPSEQTYKEKSFGIGANTMVAITDGSFLAFKNVGGYLSLRLYGDNISVSRITIKGNNGEKIAGKASIDIPFGGTPTVTMDESATDEVSIVCDPAVKIGEDASNYTDFWFVIPPVTFEQGFTITVTDDKGVVFEKATSKSFTVSRNTLDWMSALKVVPNYDNAIVPFEDANFKAYCVENFDNDGDGEISFIEAMDITDIHCDYNNYYSLEGIEYFQNLVELSCSYNQLSILDVSRCTNLTVLNCANNQLTNLNVSGCTELIALSCDDNQLTSLDVSGCTALSELGCTENQLTSLNVSNNMALTRLRCDSNQLTSLDVSKNTALTWLDCNDNQLTSLDVSNNLSLTYLSCRDNQITSMDVGHNLSLTILNCGSNQLTNLDISNNLELIRLYSHCNQLTNLDVSHNKKLLFIGCDTNLLTSINVSHNSALTELYCYKNYLSSLDVSRNASLTTLWCYSNQLTSLDVSQNASLTSLDCYGNQLTNLDVSHNNLLVGLDCSINKITSLDVSNNISLSYLNCISNLLTTLDVSNNSVLKYFYCDSNLLLTEIWLRPNQSFDYFYYDTEWVTIKYKD